MEQTMVPQQDASTRSLNPDAAAMALTGNLSQDLANVAKELGVTLDANGNVAETQPAPAPVTQVKPQETPKAPEPEQPQATETGIQRVEIPPKFQKQDGTLDQEKLEKSTVSADEAIARYRAKERELSQLQNKVNNPPQGQAQPQPASVPLSQLEIAMANDLINEAAALGVNLDQKFAIVQAKVMARGLEAKHAAELNATQDLRQRVEDNERRRELQGLIDADPELLSPGMADTLWKVRQENPWLNQAPEPWKAAYIHHQGTNGRGQQVKTPNPTGTTAKPPATPVGPVTRVLPAVDITDKRQLQGLSIEQLEVEAKKMFPGMRFGPRL